MRISDWSSDVCSSDLHHEFPAEAAFAKKVRLVDLNSPNSRFTHAKVFVALTKHHDHILFGSANCTTAALSSAGSNAEACVYRRLPAGTAVKALGLDRWIEERKRTRLKSSH